MLRQDDLQPGGACASGGPSGEVVKAHCGTTQTAIGPNNECCENDHIYTGAGGEQACCFGALTNGKCDSTPNQPDNPCPTCCAKGYTSVNGACCLVAQVTNSGVCCPTGQKPQTDGSCRKSGKIPKITQCCAAGYVPTHGGTCCAVANLTSIGSCCASAVNPKDRSQCPKQFEKTFTPPKPCARGSVRDAKGACVSRTRSPPPPALVPLKPRAPNACALDERRNRAGVCVPRRPRQIREPDEEIVVPWTPPPAIRRPIVCPPGWVLGPYGKRCWPLGRGRAAPVYMGPGPVYIGPGPAGPAFHSGGRQFACPPGMAPGPMGRCMPMRPR